MTDPLFAAKAPTPAGGWRTATVALVDHPTPRTVRLRLDVPDRVDHLPGQHYVVRLTAPDGYTAQRSYSVSSAPSDELLELLVERWPDGEVSSYLADDLQVGDRLQVRGPIGGWFVWRGDDPVLVVGGGTGVVPLVAVWRHSVHLGRTDLVRVVAAGRTPADLPYAQELTAAGARMLYSRTATATRPAARIGLDDVADLVAADPVATALVCGSAGFAETASRLLVDAGKPVGAVRVERFGPTT
ncbi:FAD-binding oxidoreductase [Nakamurella leprariae]|uniref:Oxidoreductase n=1 Tax=Nakamurella leprariae TaxID=2803911 RepID=A0A939BXP1_9ACTN|nr:FAD-binding oxidoreductase [Nakamurella leprariae]MBM9466195.1 oxidoreductase [Nakamurella leprariae]